MASEVGICNTALRWVKSSRIESLTEDSKQAATCAEEYPEERDNMLRGHPWNFATERKKLARLTERPVSEFDYAYQLPSDSLRTLRVSGDVYMRSKPRYKIEADRTLLTNEEDVYLKYIRHVVDPNEMRPDFRRALSAALAVLLAPALAGSGVSMERLEAKARSMLRKAKSVDAQEGFPDRLEEGAWTGARHAGWSG